MPRYSRYKSTSSSSGDRGSSSSSSDPCSDINPSNPIPYPSSDSSDRRRRSMAPSPPPHSSYRRRPSSPHRPDSQTPAWSSSSADGSATPARSQTPTLRDAYGSHECRATGGDCRSPSPTYAPSYTPFEDSPSAPRYISQAGGNRFRSYSFDSPPPPPLPGPSWCIYEDCIPSSSHTSGSDDDEARRCQRSASPPPRFCFSSPLGRRRDDGRDDWTSGSSVDAGTRGSGSGDAGEGMSERDGDERSESASR
ncbi:hypothetical protein B2J93_2508 [Marssonina coronariae]|uniref:Uncharacterized protein n=1 Tax=Diplocarpon coronariae TaxID=2795749 RepID=A0A218ZF99_9HELO|nr:hypothetical protein B2J93_2508 [Marssonina coronariae]